MRGPHRGDLFGIAATGRRIRVGRHQHRAVVDGRIAEIWHVEDIAGLMAQIGSAAADSVA